LRLRLHLCDREERSLFFLLSLWFVVAIAIVECVSIWLRFIGIQQIEPVTNWDRKQFTTGTAEPGAGWF
jgi:hypothetical protein